MKDLQVVAFGMNPLQGSFYGVEASCSSGADKIAAFQGHGYLQLRSPRSVSRSDFSLGLTFKTQANDGVLVYVLPASYVRIYAPHSDSAVDSIIELFLKIIYYHFIIIY